MRGSHPAPAFICLRSGKCLWFEPLDVSAVTIEDVAYSLSRLPRFLGHNLGPVYSVAEHSVRVSYLLEDMGASPVIALQGLLHDCTEMAVADLPAPFKALDVNAGYRTFELRLQRALFQHFGLPPTLHEVVGDADRKMLRIEVASFMPNAGDTRVWGAYTPAIEDRRQAFTPFTEAAARQWFLARFEDLMDVIDD
jgi:5'-deoxynucleotidase YfbR-like HD superfamily hydrolase